MGKVLPLLNLLEFYKYIASRDWEKAETNDKKESIQCVVRDNGDFGTHQLDAMLLSQHHQIRATGKYTDEDFAALAIIDWRLLICPTIK
jgi:hypothetical protein